MDNYTPYHKETNVRLSLRLSDEDLEKMVSAGRNTLIKGDVTDLNTGNQYRIQGATCGIPHCTCDASAEPLPALT